MVCIYESSNYDDLEISSTLCSPGGAYSLIMQIPTTHTFPPTKSPKLGFKAGRGLHLNSCTFSSGPIRLWKLLDLVCGNGMYIPWHTVFLVTWQICLAAYWSWFHVPQQVILQSQALVGVCWALEISHRSITEINPVQVGLLSLLQLLYALSTISFKVTFMLF